MENSECSISGNDIPRPWSSYDTVYTNAKAGMEGVDKEKVKRIVYEMSKGSKFFENEEKKEAYMKRKIENMRAQLAKFTPVDVAHYQKIADKRLVDLEASRDLSKIWLHVDMDAFYAAVETLSDPSLEGKAMAVGSLSMISTANYEARKFGVRAAMPGFIAKKLCPDLIIVPVDFRKYTHYSDLTRKVFQKYDPNFLAASLDEAYLDITNFCSDMGMTGGQVAAELRESVHNETGLTCSAGVAPNRLLAKVCSDINKPNGQFLLPNDRIAVLTFVSSLPIRKIGGIGKVTENVLKEVLGISNCEEMLQRSGFIFALFSPSSADFFLSVSLGLGKTDTPQANLRKSMSTERTFSSTENEESLIQKLVDLSENLSADLKKENLRGKTLTLKLKTSFFEVRTRAVTLPQYIFSHEDILKHAMKLLKAELPVSLRLMGLRMSHFSEDHKGDPKQKTLSNFLNYEGALEKRLEDHPILLSNQDNDISFIEGETSFCSNTHGESDLIDLVDAKGAPIHGHLDLRQSDNSAEVEGSFDPQGTTGMLHSRAEIDLSSTQRDEIHWSSDDQQLTLNQKEPKLWLNDYKCSICGIELPSSFVHERQEHSDFHLAEKLQEEESSTLRIPTPRKRLIEKDRKTSHSQQKKKPKAPSDGKHIPIDSFFTKTSQNL